MALALGKQSRSHCKIAHLGDIAFHAQDRHYKEIHNLSIKRAVAQELKELSAELVYQLRIAEQEAEGRLEVSKASCPSHPAPPYLLTVS